VRVLAIVHEDGPVVGVFGEVARELGHEIEQWGPGWGAPPSRPFEDYDAVWVFGGMQNTHEEDDYPWLRDEDRLIRGLIAQGTPMLGVCLGGQLIAKAAGARVERAAAPEIGFTEVEVLPAAGADPIFSALPPRLRALQWHYYRFDVPVGATMLARSELCPQAYRLGDVVWGLQFHPETTREDFLRWVSDYERMPDADPTGFDAERLRQDTETWIDQWNAVGRAIARRFLELAALRPREGPRP
jgi:GMP synthase-like glutamine amidotransferase